jgi:hypothetical protein
MDYLCFFIVATTILAAVTAVVCLVHKFKMKELELDHIHTLEQTDREMEAAGKMLKKFSKDLPKMMTSFMKEMEESL